MHAEMALMELIKQEMENRVKNHLLFSDSNCIVMLNYSASNELFAAKLFFFGPFPLRTLLDYCMRYCCCILESRTTGLKGNAITSLGMVGKSPFWHSWLGLNLNFEYK